VVTLTQLRGTNQETGMRSSARHGATRATILFRAATLVAFGGAALMGCSNDDDNTGAGAAASVSVVSGNTQTGVVATAVTNPVMVQVKDANGNPVSGATVTFAVTGSATLGNTTVQTDASGNASTTVMLGNTSGNVVVTASVAGVTTPATFNLTATPDVAASLVVVSGNNQSGSVGVALANPMVVRVNDQYGNAVSGASVDWTTTGGTLSGTTQEVTTADGTASIGLELPATAGDVTTTATLHGTANTATFTSTAM
jgi:Big-like domain-containing protein